MLPAHARILICPHCKAEKEVLSLMSGNTFGATYWSDNKQIAPMLPRVSFVQKCAECGHYYILSQVKREKQGSSYSSNRGDLSWSEMKEALEESKSWKMEDNEELNFRMTAVWVFNDKYYRNNEGTAAEPTDEDLEMHHNNLKALLLLISDDVLKAEYYRELGDFDQAITLIDSADLSRRDEFIAGVAAKIRAKSQEKDAKPFVISGN